jgi:predicted dehydrogenase
MSASLLLLGYSSIASRRVIPAARAVAVDQTVDIASKTRRVPPDGAGHGVIFNDYDTALEKSSAGAVYISLPNAMHFEVAKKALQSGRHVIIDKPACVTIEETEALLNSAAKAGRLLAEATVFNYHRQFDEISSFVEQNGPLECVSAQFVIPPLPIENFRNHRELGGGCLLDMGPYVAALARIFLGERGLQVYALAGGAHRQTGVDAGFAVLAGVPGGARLTGHFSFQGEYQNRLTLIGAGGSLATERVFSLPADVAPLWLTRIKNSESEIVLAKDDAFASFLRGVFRAIDAGEHASFARDLLRDVCFRERLTELIGA